MYDIYDNDFDKAFDEAVDAIEKQASKDYIKVIRCKDCEYFVLASGHRRCDLRCKEMVEPEGFCSWAKKRED